MYPVLSIPIPQLEDLGVAKSQLDNALARMFPRRAYSIETRYQRGEVRIMVDPRAMEPQKLYVLTVQTRYGGKEGTYNWRLDNPCERDERAHASRSPLDYRPQVQVDPYRDELAFYPPEPRSFVKFVSPTRSKKLLLL